MSIEDKLFARYRPDFCKFPGYGFVWHDDGSYYLQKQLEKQDFRAEIRITQEGRICGKLYDLSFEDAEYTLFRIKDAAGAFVHQVREEYERILLDIREHCFDRIPFISPQMNRIAALILEKYGDKPQFEWPGQYPGYASFRFHDSGAWYAIAMNVDKSKFDKQLSGEIEIIDVRLNTEKIKELLKKDGFYPQLGMNRRWISIALDETHTDQEVMDYIDESYQYVCGNRAANEWIVPANPNYYDVCEEFDHNDIVLWKQSTNIRTGDIVYLYVTSPVSAILYRGRVLETGIPYEYQDENMKMSFAIKLQVLNRYDREKYGLEVLKKYGVNSVRGPRYMTKELSRMIADQNDE